MTAKTAKILTFPAPTKLLAAVNALAHEGVIEGEILTAEPCDAPKRRKPRAKMRVEQIEVTCTRVPRKQHRDLRMSGVLTIDWKGDVAWTMTFDGDDENVPNIVAPIEAFARDADSIKVTSDEGTWVFAPLAEDDEDEE